MSTPIPLPSVPQVSDPTNVVSLLGVGADGSLVRLPMSILWGGQVLTGASLDTLMAPGIYTIWQATDLPQGLSPGVIYTLLVLKCDKGCTQILYGNKKICMRQYVGNPLVLGAWNIYSAAST